MVYILYISIISCQLSLADEACMMHGKLCTSRTSNRPTAAPQATQCFRYRRLSLKSKPELAIRFGRPRQQGLTGSVQNWKCILTGFTIAFEAPPQTHAAYYIYIRIQRDHLGKKMHPIATKIHCFAGARCTETILKTQPLQHKPTSSQLLERRALNVKAIVRFEQ
jgi:hypothetical protein